MTDQPETGTEHETRGWLRDPLLWLILLSAFALRFYMAAATTYVWDEDRDWIPLALSIDPAAGEFPIRGPNHGALAGYFIALGSWILGVSHVGLRIVNVLLGVACVAAMYRMVLPWAGRATAHLSALLLAIAEYHVFASAIATEKSLHILLVMISIAAFAAFIRSERTGPLFLAAISIAFAFLCNERAALFLPIFTIALFWTGKGRLLKNPRVYVAAVVAIAIIAPDMLWNSGSEEASELSYSDHLSRIDGIGFQRQYLLFYFRPAVTFLYDLIGKRLHDEAGEYATVNQVLGVLLVAGVLLATWRFKRADAMSRILLSVFWFLALFFTFVGQRDPGASTALDVAMWNWIELTLLAAVPLTAYAITSFEGRIKQVSLALVAGGALLSVALTFGAALDTGERAAICMPEQLIPPDGRDVDVMVHFDQALFADDVERVELVSITTGPQRGDLMDAVGVYATEVEIGTDDREFRLRADIASNDEGDPIMRVYRVEYRLHESDGDEVELVDIVYVPIGPGDPIGEFPPAFWAR